MKKKKYYLGKRHVRPFKWLHPEYSNKVPRMLREYYRMIVCLSGIAELGKMNVNSSFGMLGRKGMAFVGETPDPRIADEMMRESLARRRAIKKAVLGKAPFHVLRDLLSSPSINL